MTPNAAIEVHARAQAIACNGIGFGELRGACLKQLSVLG
jgi:hypothetical protein